MTRPEISIDWKKVDDLMTAGCLGTEVAGFFGIHPNTFYRRVEEHYKISFSEYSAQKKSNGEALIRAKQYEKALGLTNDGDNTLLIWLGKTRLKQADEREHELKKALIDHEIKAKTEAGMNISQEVLDKFEATMSLVTKLQAKNE